MCRTMYVCTYRAIDTVRSMYCRAMNMCHVAMGDYENYIDDYCDLGLLRLSRLLHTIMYS